MYFIYYILYIGISLSYPIFSVSFVTASELFYGKVFETCKSIKKYFYQSNHQVLLLFLITFLGVVLIASAAVCLA